MSRISWVLVFLGCADGGVGANPPEAPDDAAARRGRQELLTYAWGVSGDDLYPIDQEWFGTTVASNGDVNGDGYDDVVVGAPGNCCQSIPGRVSAYFGSSTAGGPHPVADWTFEDDIFDTEFGASVALADLDGDGFSDVVVGATFVGSPPVQVFPGSSTGPSAAPVWTLSTPVGISNLGQELATGDVNGDGFADVAVGAGSSGTALVFHGSAGGPDILADWSRSGDETFAEDLALGDVNGDGFDDLVVSDSQKEQVEVHLGSAAGLIPAQPATLLAAPAGAPNVVFGSSVAAGDVNGDGLADVIVGGIEQDPIWTEHGGALFVFLGAPTVLGVDTVPVWTYLVKEELETTNFGERVEWAGDLDGDGFGDIASGEEEFDSRNGRVQVFRGSSDGPSVPTWVELGKFQDGFGNALGSAGDLNADGFDDLVVAALDAFPEGALHLFLGGRLIDPDGDGVTASSDVCPTVPNPDQTDSNGDGLGDDCEPVVLVLHELSVSAGLTVDVSNAFPGEAVRVFLANGPPVDEPCPKRELVCLEVGEDGRVSWTVNTDQNGQGSLVGLPLPNTVSAGQTVTIQAAVERGVGGVTSLAFGLFVDP